MALLTVFHNMAFITVLLSNRQVPTVYHQCAVGGTVDHNFVDTVIGQVDMDRLRQGRWI